MNRLYCSIGLAYIGFKALGNWLFGRIGRSGGVVYLGQEDRALSLWDVVAG